MSRSTAILTLSGHMLDFISVRDHRLMRRVHRWRAPRWVRILMVCASRAGDGWLWLAVGLGLITQAPTGPAALSAASLAAGVGLGIYVAVKRATGRKRPCLIEPHCWAHMLPPDQYSFPSGHTITAFSMAITVGLFFPSCMLVLLCAAALIAASRIVLGMHFLSDVLVGIAIGTSLGYAAFLLVSPVFLF
jgi:undecaprenyl-diphosphatase